MKVFTAAGMWLPSPQLKASVAVAGTYVLTSHRPVITLCHFRKMYFLVHPIINIVMIFFQFTVCHLSYIKRNIL